jgi:hypothetical protein
MIIIQKKRMQVHNKERTNYYSFYIIKFDITFIGFLNEK